MSKIIVPRSAQKITPILPASLVESLRDVPFGQVTPNKFIAAIYAGHDFTSIPLAVRSADRARLNGVRAHPDGLVTWEGPIPDNTGHFVIGNPYSTRKVGPYDPASLIVGAGLTNAAIGEITTLSCEVDEAEDGGRMLMEDQAALYDSIERDSGLRFSAAVLSGDARPGVELAAELGQFDVLTAGKSLHVFLAVIAVKPTPENLALRQEAVDALVALVNADAACRDLSHKMRHGGVVAREQTGSLRTKVRVQTCIRAETVAFDLRDVRDRLVLLCRARGIDVGGRISALQLVARARALARSWERAAAAGTATTEEAIDAASTLREAALAVRRAGVVLAIQRRIVEAVGGPVGKVTVITATGERREIHVVSNAGAWDPSTTTITHTSGATGTAEQLWNSHLRGTRVPDIHCVGHADAHASAFLTRRKGGIFAVHCPSCTAVFESSPVARSRRKTIEEMNVAEDSLAGCTPPLETTAARLLRDGNFGDVIRLVVPADYPSDEAVALVGEALRGLDGVDDEAERDNALKVYEERLAKKLEKANALNRQGAALRVTGARRAMTLASELVGPLRKKMRAEGLPLPDPKVPCGVHLGLHHAGDGRFAVVRQVCKLDSCPTCAPVVIARRIAAVLCCPVTNKNGLVTGAPLGERPIWVFTLDEDRLSSFTGRWREAYHRLSLIDHIEEDPTKEKVVVKESPRERGHVYVAFHLAGRRVAVLSTLDVPVIRKRKGQPPIIGKRGENREAIRHLVEQLGMHSYRVVGGDGAPDLGATVVGSIRASYGLSLDPAEIARTAKVSQWVGLGALRAGVVRAAMETRKIEHKAKERDGAPGVGGVVESVASVGYVAPSVVMEIVAEAREVPKAGAASMGALPPDERPPEINLDDLFAESA